MKIHNILLATDFSPSSQAALQYAVVVAKRYQANLVVVHVVSESVYAEVPSELLAEAKTRTIADVRTRLEQFRPGLEELQTEFILEEGHVADTLLALTQSKSIDLVIVGTRGHRRLERFLLGSVAEKLSRQAGCPVLVVPESAVSYEERSQRERFFAPRTFRKDRQQL